MFQNRKYLCPFELTVSKPSIFALTYTATVANFPQAIFVLAAVLAFASVVLLVGVRLSVKDIAAVHAASAEEEIPLNGILLEDEDEE
jgi:hypothetical protein